MAGDKTKNAILPLLLSLLALINTFQHNYHSSQLVVTPNAMVGLYFQDYPLNDPPLFLSYLPLALGSSEQRQFTQCQEDPNSMDKYNSLHVNRIQKTYGAKMIRLLGSFRCQDLATLRDIYMRSGRTQTGMSSYRSHVNAHLDVCSPLYSNIPQEEGIEIVCRHYEEHYQSNLPILTSFLGNLMRLILTETHSNSTANSTYRHTVLQQAPK